MITSISRGLRVATAEDLAETLQMVEAMPDNAILVDEGLTSSRQTLSLRPHRDRYGYHALASGGIRSIHQFITRSDFEKNR